MLSFISQGMTINIATGLSRHRKEPTFIFPLRTSRRMIRVRKTPRITVGRFTQEGSILGSLQTSSSGENLVKSMVRLN